MSGIPKNEVVWVEIVANNGNEYYITSKMDDRSWYFLYGVTDDGEVVKLGKNKNPMVLENRIDSMRNSKSH